MKGTLHTASILKILKLVLCQKKQYFSSGKRHTPKVMKMRPQIQIYAKQWT